MNQEALNVLKERRSIRAFKPEQITDEELAAVLEAGTYAPTSRGKQSPTIVAVQDPETVALLDKLNGEILNPGGNAHPYYGAPTILVVLVPKDANLPIQDGSLVTGNLLNAAYAAGLGSCWIHRMKEVFETEEGKALLAKWGLPDNLMGVASVALGYADCELPEAPARKENYVVYVK